MLINIQKLSEARVYITRLSEGLNPLNGEPLGDSPLNDADIIRVMYYVRELLDRIASGDIRAKEKSAFPYEILDEYKYTGDLGITNIIRKICAPIKGENVQMPSPQMAGAWLRENGYLVSEYVDEYNGDLVHPTEKGKALGIYTKNRQYQGRRFVQIYYSRPAQEFIVANFDKILNYRKSDF